MLKFSVLILKLAYYAKKSILAQKGNITLLEKMRPGMVIENLSPRTITSYLNGPKRLIESCNKDPKKISIDEIYAFLVC